MTRAEIIKELRECEHLIYKANMHYQYGGGKRPSEAIPLACARRNELANMLRLQQYEGGRYFVDD